MLESLVLKNFQCHKDIRLDFHAGVNVIAGSSDSGKSAILKGLFWLLQNRPHGLQFRNWDCGNGTVEASAVIDGHTVNRIRNDKANEYVMDGKKYVAMKNDVPKEIAAFLRLGDVNIQTQFMPHYLLSDSAGEVSRVLNESCDLSIIDRTVKAISTKASQAKTQAKAAGLALEKVEQELAGLDWVDDAMRLVEDVKKEARTLSRLEQQKDSLDSLIERFRAIMDKKLERSRQGEAYDRIAKLDKPVRKWVAESEQYMELWRLVCDYEDIRNRRKRISLDCFDGLEAAERELDALQKDEDVLAELSLLADRYDLRWHKAREAKAILNQTRKELEAAWEQAGVCPLCGRPLEKRV